MELRVFLVEDLRSIRTLMGELFSAIGGLRLVGSAATEAEAKLWLCDNPDGWDLVIIDLILDEGSGIEVLREAKHLAPRSRAVVFSSFASPGIRAHCLSLGADAVFDKVDTASFVSWLDEEVHRRPSAGPSP
jgi:DNA-binding NarL/FixJ family response regulator